MGSVRHRLSEARHDCNVVLIGDCKVGKTALVHRFINNKFTEAYRATQHEKFTTSALVDNKRVKFTIWDTSGSSSSSSSKILACREADVFLLCYKISDPSTLFSALNFWVPEIRLHTNYSIPIVLVGCASDLRTNREVLSSLSKQGKAPVSTDQALSICQRIGGVTYVETSVKASARAAISAFEVAGLASMGKITSPNQNLAISKRLPHNSSGPHQQECKESATTKVHYNKERTIVTDQSPDSSLERKDNAGIRDIRGDIYGLEPAEQFWEQFNSSLIQSPKISRSISAPRTPSLGSASSRTASLSSSKTKSNTSIPSITSCGPTHIITTKQPTSYSSWLGTKTPKTARRSSTLNSKSTQSQSKMIKIRCQRFNTEDKIYEEIEVEVPAPIYETIQVYNETESPAGKSSRKDKYTSSYFSGRRASLGVRLKNLFTPTSTAV